MSTFEEFLKGKRQNNGSGAVYLLGKAAEGFAGSITGTLTTVLGGLHKLFGNDEEAERYVRMFSGETGEADYRFNPDDSWKMAGDVAQGIGNSLPMMAVGVAGGAAIGSAIGAAGLTGTAAKIASVAGNKLVTFTSSFLSATGSGVQEAYQKTGKVDDKAWKSGVASGVIEGGTEALLDLGVGGVTSQAINLGSKIAGTAATAAAKRFSSKIGVQIAKDLAGSFISEALEEGVSAILSPIANNIIYQDEIARGEMEKETLDWHDIGYQMLVGGLSGVIMGGANTIVSESVSTARGAEAIRSGKVDQIMQSAQEIFDAYSGDETVTKTASYKRLQNALQNAEKAKGLAAARYVAEVQESSAAVALSDQVVTSARQILTNPEAVATRINQFSMKDTDGNTISVTAEQIRNSVKNGNLAEALSEDGNILRKLAVLDAAGRMYADTQAYESAVERGEYLGDRADVAHFLQTASTEEVQAVNNALGLDIATASYDDIRAAFVNKSVNAAFGGQQEARQGGQASLTAQETENNTQEAQNTAQERTNGAEQSADTTVEAENATEAKKSAAQARAETEKTLSENVSQWDRMPSRNRTLVRQTYTQAVNNGYSAEDALTFARLSAKAGINIEFTENGMQTASGDTVDGYYDRGENVIVVNPKSKKPFESILIHELTHSLEKTTRYGRVMDQSLKSLSETERNRIIALYQPVTQGKSAAEKVEILSSEYTAHYTEKALKSKKFLEALVKEDRTIADRIRSFFEQRFGDDKLDRNARKLAKAYEKAFSEMAQRNFGANAVSVEKGLSPSVPQYNLSAVETHRKNLAEKITKNSALTASELDEEYMKSVRLWERVTKKLNSRFLDDWNAKTVRTREFTVLKEQQGYPYNEELATSCVKAVPLFEAIDKIVSDGTVDQLNVDVIGKSEKEILYKLLSEKGFQIPCAICYVEQARQREGVIINAFINGEESRGKLGWNSVIASISDKMRQMGKPYDFIVQDAALLKDSYDMSEIRMDEETENAFIKAAVDLCNEEIGRENAKRKESFEKGKSKKYNPYSEIKGYSASAIKNALKGSLSENLGIFQTLLLEPNSRFKIGKSTLYSTIATKNLAAFHHRLYALFNKQAGTAGYKTKQLPVIYWGDVLARKWKPSDLRKKGGMRSQSNSDYQMYTFLDVMQLYADLTAKGYTAHEYTKVLSLVKLFGLSGVKINTSLIPRVVVYRNSDGTVDVAKTQEYAGLAEDGKTPIYDDVEGINHEEAFSIISDAEYSKSVGGICIGYSDRHIAALLDDPRVQLIIGYHDKTDNPDKRYAKARYAHNYNGENEAKTETGETKHIAFNTFVMEAEKLFKRSKDGRSFTGEAQYMGNTYTADEIPRLATKMYLDYCEANGYTPAYPQFASHKNYYKLLADFNLYDSMGHYAPQNSVRLRIPSTVPIRNTDGTVSRMNTEDYIVKELRSEMQMRDDLAEALADKSPDGIIPQFVKRVNERSESNIAAPQGGRQFSVSSNESRGERLGMGYSGYSMSNNAVAAYQRGEKPISKWTKADILQEVKRIDPEKVALIRSQPLKMLKKYLLTQTSWHHTSSRFNETDFYYINEEYLADLTAQNVSEWEADDAKTGDKTFRGTFKYIEWTGTAKHPKANPITLENVNITEKGSFYIVTDDDGKVLVRKKIDSNGTEAINAEEEQRKRQESEDNDRRIRENSDPEAYRIFKNSSYSDRSQSGNIYEPGRKPSPSDYDNGIENYFRVGEKRATLQFQNGSVGYALEVWNGKEWVRQNETSVARQGRQLSISAAQNTEITTDVNGRHAQFVANNTRREQYTVRDAREVVSDIIAEMRFGDENETVQAKLSGNDRNAVVAYLFDRLNSVPAGNRAGVALKIADYIVENAVLEEVFDSVRTEQITEAKNVVSSILRYKNKFNLSAIRSDIKSVYDTKAAGKTMLWGGGNMTADKIAMELADDGINIKAVNEAEIFTEIMDAYDRAKSELAERANTYKLEQYGTEEEVQAEKQRIAKEILAAYEERGKETTFARLTDRYTRRISELRDALRESYSYNRLANRLTAQAQQIADWKKGVFSNATQIRGDAALSMVGELGKISFRGNVNHARTRQIVGELYQWYQENAKELGSRYNLQVAEMMNEIASAQKYMTDEESRAVDNAIELYQQKGNSIASFNSTELLRTLAKWYNKKNTGKNYNPGTAYLLKRLANATMLTAQEMQTMSNILAYFKKFVEGYNKAFIRGKRVDAGRSANLYILEAQNAAARTRKQNGKRVHKYEQAFFDPMSVAREADGYQKGFFTDILTDIRNGTVNAEITRMNVRRGLEEFYAKHKKFLTNADKETVKYNGQDLTKREAMQVYMTLQRKQAQAGMTINGFQIVRKKGEILRVNGVLSPLDFHSDEDIAAEANRLAEELKKQFSADDLAYIELAEKAYLECRELKKKADIDRLGFSNVESGYYVPIKIANKGESIDADYFGEGNSVNNQSFNKSTVRHKHELLIQPIDQVLETHIRGIAQYNALHRAFDAFDILFNIDTRENPNKVKSIRTETARTWEGAFSYFAKLRDDITGKNQPIDGFNAAVSFLRGGYAKAALGLNPKVLATQLSSVFASTSILDYNDIARSANMKTDKSELYKYCPLAEVRNLENTAFKAAGVVDKVGGVGDVLMKPIGTVDAFVISRLWNACQVSVERRSDLKIGTEENKVEAGKLLKQVILETQQNATATDRSGAMRSHSELARAITMFTADAMKVFNRVVDSVGSVLTVQSLIRDANGGNTQAAYDLLEAQIRAEAEEQASAETDDAEKIRDAGEKAVSEKLEQAKADYLPNLQKEYKTAKRKLRKAIGALLSSSAYMAIIGFLFRKLYRKKDEEPADTLLDFTANLVNGMPIMKEIAAFALQGYDISVPSFEVINGMMNTAKSVFNAVGSGDGEKILKSFKNLLISAGQLTGLPVRNAINIFNAFRYEIVDIVNGEPFSFRAGTTVAPADIAYEYYVAGKTKQQEIYMNKISDDKDKQNKAIQTHIRQLYGNGKLSRDEAIKQLQDFGLTKADAEWLLDKDKYSDKKVSQSSYEKYKKIEKSGISEDVYFDFVDKVSAFTSDKDKNGETISGTLRAKVLKEIRKLKLTTDQKLLILASRGYTAKDGDIGGLTAESAQKRLLAYVRRVTSGMSKEEKKEFAKMFGMKLKNNLIFL